MEAVVTAGPEPAFADGWLDASLAEEYPHLRLREITVPVRAGRSSRSVRRRLEHLSGRISGAEAVATRTRPIPHAYRVFFRHVGIDPDTQRTPIEQAVIDRLVDGEFKARNRIDDALLVALAETGVPIWALDEAPLDGPLGLRESRAGEPIGTGEHADEAPPGRLVLADAERAVGVLFGKLAPSHEVSKESVAVRLFTIQVPGVPDAHVSEALWTCLECLAAE